MSQLRRDDAVEHIHTTMQMLAAEPIEPRTQRLVQNSRVGNGFGMIVLVLLTPAGRPEIP